jgi:tRNA-dihydrouridine synthase
MKNNFWDKIKKRPFFCLAPMIDVTDSAFRALFAKYGKPDVVFTRERKTFADVEIYGSGATDCGADFWF